MRHNSVVSGHPKSTGILWVDELLTGPWIWGVTRLHTICKMNKYKKKYSIRVYIFYAIIIFIVPKQ